MLRLPALAILFSALLHTMQIQAASGTGEFAIKDAGLATCKQYAEEQKKVSKRYFHYVGWIMGYFSSYNRYAEDTVDITPWQTTDLLAALIGNFCRTNPDVLLVVTANQFIDALNPYRLRNSSKKIEVKVGKESVFIYEAILTRVQQMLYERGNLKGTPDGKFGPATQQAIKDFQKANKLKTTGLPDQSTLLLLFAKQ